MIHRENLAAERRVLGPEHPQTLEIAFNLADRYDQDRYGEAETLAMEAVAGYERTKVDDNEPVGGARVAVRRALLGLKRYLQAESTLIAAEQVLSNVKGTQRKKCLESLVALYEAWEKSAPGAAHAAQAATWKAKLASSHRCWVDGASHPD